MLIDFHTHAFPEKLAPRALSSLAKRIRLEPLSDGTVTGLIRKMDEGGVDRSVICNIATNPHQTEKVNDFAIATQKEYGSRVVPLGSIHPHYERIEDEIERLRENGIRGLKLHPDYMETMLDDPVFDPIFDAAAVRGMFLVTHAGFDVYSTAKVYANPTAIRNRIRRSPKAELICAHYGGSMMWTEAERTLLGEPVTIDTSMGSVFMLPREQAARMLLRHDGERIVFGSDFPWCSPEETFR